MIFSHIKSTMDEKCLPKEVTKSVLTKTLRNILWGSRLVNRALASKNDNESRKFFMAHPELIDKCEEMNNEIHKVIENFQKEAEEMLSNYRVETLNAQMNGIEISDETYDEIKAKFESF